MKKTLEYLRNKKSCGKKISMLTCYDYPTAILEEEAGVDIILVGDSVGTNVLGYKNEREVTMDDMIHHLKAVRRGVKNSYLLVDMPYGSYDTIDCALDNAKMLLSFGADGVKIEGEIPEIVSSLNNYGIEVCSHLGFTPQRDATPGLRANTASSAFDLIQAAIAVEQAGASLILFETIPEEVAKYLSNILVVPTLGIGSGRFTDGQVLVVLDILGINSFDLRHNKKYEYFSVKAAKALTRYIQDVESGTFPAEKNLWHLKKSELAKLMPRITNV